jgi:Clp amino terminal domain, pathogenicity island component
MRPKAMFERYTEHARRVIFFARYEASNLGDTEIDTQHLLLGLMREDTGLLLDYIDKERALSIRNHIESEAAVRNQGRKLPTSGDMPLSTDGKRVLAYAAEEAQRLEDKHIGNEHLLLGILRETRTSAGKLLAKCGLDLNAVREHLNAPGVTRPLAVSPASEQRPRRRTADDCIEFIDVDTGERVGIIGIHSNYPLPRATDFVLLQPRESGMNVRYEVLEVLFEYRRQMPSLPYRIEHLNNITVRVRRASERSTGFSEST